MADSGHVYTDKEDLLIIQEDISGSLALLYGMQITLVSLMK